ncbi:MAG: translation initiation factor IF-2 [Planctomycetota bacterium]
MAKSLRVFNLAKELGVSSKDIVAKCDAEGVPGITNHMSTVKVGLAVTIRQWFGDAGEGGAVTATAIETAEPVAPEVKKKAAKKKAAKKKAPPKKVEAPAEPPEPAPAEVPVPTPVSADEAPTAIVETPAETVEPPAEPAPEAPAEIVPVEPAPAVAAEAPSPTPDEPAETPAAPAEITPVGKQNVPDRPDVVKPAGEQLTTPQKATMRGPRVIRVEKPDEVEKPRSAGGPRGPRSGGNPSLAPGEVQGITRTRGPARGGGVRSLGGPDEAPARGGGGAPGGPRGGPGGGGGGGRRRTLSTRRGRAGDSQFTGPTQFSQADLDELDKRMRGASGFIKKRRHDMRRGEHTGSRAESALERGGAVEVEEPLTIKNLSAATGIRAADIVKWLFKQGMMSNVNATIETEAAEEVCLEYGIELQIKEHETAEQRVEKEFAQREQVDVQPRPPVVTVLGHVDHGKTSLLDRIRSADVASHEDGGITQHVGAYRVSVEGSDGANKTVVFLDTPGHAAFTQMRSRGAQLTDLAVLVVAADDGVMPTTVESINHAKAAGVPIVVAMNKIDLPGVTEEAIQKIYGQLAEHGLNPTAWGGETEVVKASAHTGEGIPELLEVLDLQSQILEFTADYGGPARGAVIEAEMQPGRGSVARVLVQDGTVSVGDFVVAGRAFGRVRDMTDDRGRKVQVAGPATPVEMSGLDQIPDAGDRFYSVDSLRKAEDVATQYRDDERQQMLASRTKVTLDNFAATIQAGKVQELRVVLKGDVQGSVETLRGALEEIGNQEVAVRVLHAAVGGITESDLDLADASDAIVIGFQVTATPAIREMADQRSIDLRFYRVIYDLVDDVKAGLEGMLAPDQREEEVGRAQVKAMFKISKVGAIAGCLVTDGAVRNQDDIKVRVSRDGVVVTDERSVASLRRVKDEVKEVRVGTECGIRIEGYDDVKPGDEILFYRTIEVARKLEA